MNTRQLISNAFLLPPLNPSPEASRFLLETYVGTLYRAGVAMAAHLYLRGSPTHSPFLEPDIASSIDDAVALSGPLTSNLNKRFSLPQTTILYADDPAIYKTLAALPESVFSKTQQPFITISRRYEGGGMKALRHSLHNAYIRMTGELKHVGAALHAFYHNKIGSEYNPYARMAIAHYLDNNKAPILFSIGESNEDGQAIKIISLANGRSLDLWKDGKLLETPSLNSLKAFFVFSHELGHAVEGHEWKASMDSMLSSRFADYGSMEDGRGWVSECFADVFSACLCAKLTGNWDVVSSVMLPFRAVEPEIHNTYAVLDLLVKENPGAMVELNERELMLYAAQATERLIIQRFERGLHKDDYDAGQFVALTHHSMTSSASRREALSGGRDFNLAAHRVQSMVDALVIDSLYSGVAAKPRDIFYLSRHFQQLGQNTSSNHFMEIAKLPPDERLARLVPFARPSVVQVAERMTSNVMAIDDYMDVLKVPESAPHLKQDPEKGRHFAETKTLAL